MAFTAHPNTSPVSHPSAHRPLSHFSSSLPLTTNSRDRSRSSYVTFSSPSLHSSLHSSPLLRSPSSSSARRLSSFPSFALSSSFLSPSALSLLLLSISLVALLFSLSYFPSLFSLFQRKSPFQAHSSPLSSLLPLPFLSLLRSPLDGGAQKPLFCQNFLFSRPSRLNTFFVASRANWGAGIGHSFGEWVHAPSLGAILQVEPLVDDFYGNSQRWTNFLGFSEGEDNLIDLFSRFERIRVINVGYERYEPLNRVEGFTTVVREQRDWHEQLLKRIASTSPAYVNTSLHVKTQQDWEDKWKERMQWERDIEAALTEKDLYNFTAVLVKRSSTFTLSSSMHNDVVASNSAITTSRRQHDITMLAPLATVISLDRVHVPHPADPWFCQKQTHLIMRRKYCLARVRKPVQLNLYEPDRQMKHIPVPGLPVLIVAVHLRCGDSCFDYWRATPFDSMALTLSHVDDLLVSTGFGLPYYHVFSQKPLNGTAEHHFSTLRQLMSEKVTNGTQLSGLSLVDRSRWHFRTHSHDTLHHLATSDLLIGSSSSFTLLGSILHFTTVISPVVGCRYATAQYNRERGTFNNKSFMQSFAESMEYKPYFSKMGDCEKYVE